ncbi:MAG: DUF1961 family protein [Candidatus Hydrogenedentes bacterium]|nr:DUF1961 family protein [Candidatus Hydrogenedentota bacterium]
MSVRLQWVCTSVTAIVLAGIVFSGVAAAETGSTAWTAGPRGTVSFIVAPSRSFHNGPTAENIKVNVLDIPGLAKITFSQDTSSCGLVWSWDKKSVPGALPLNVLFPGLPGGERYHLMYTWDADAGVFSGYFNGVPMRMPGTVVERWRMDTRAIKNVDFGEWNVKDLRIYPEYMSGTDATDQVPTELRGMHADLMGKFPPRPAIDVNRRLGKLLYASSLADSDSVAGWVLEGPGIISHEDGWIKMASKRPEGPEGNIVYWAPPDFPVRFVADWEMQILSKEGLCIVFFSAKGTNGQDLFDPTLPPRDGVFKKYTKGAIRAYHISYYTNNPTARPGRVTSNLRKNPGFYLATIGPAGIPIGSKNVHKVRLIRDNAHMQLLIDGKVIIDYTDNGKTYGPLHGNGKIGFRQMKWTVARYRNLKVWTLKKP